MKHLNYTHTQMILYFLLILSITNIIVISFVMSFAMGNSVDNRDTNIIVQMAFFYDPDCPCSQEVMLKIIPELDTNYTYLDVIWYDVTTTDNWTLSQDFIDGYNLDFLLNGQTP